ncbi:MAG: hypothetical protein IT304_06070 [Dehalococcoidia bacterium]|nr:hypothetical protein [Dehalococcoidia bacterium]
MTGGERVYHLALEGLHASLGARFAVQAGWSVPEEYVDAVAEHAAVRESAVAYDASSASRIMVMGTDAPDVLDAVFAGHVSEVEEGRALRTVALDERGTIRDLVLVARTGGIAFMVLGSAGQRAETLGRLQAAAAPGFDMRVEDRTESTCQIGLAGPAAAEIARAHMADGLPARLQTLQCAAFELHGFRALAVRTTDLGEDGFAFVVAPAVAQHLLETLVAAGVSVAGHAAREVARIEACIPAFVPDLEPGLSPAEADLDVLLGVPGGADGRMLAALLLEGEEPLPAGTPVASGGERVGEVRSCVHSAALGATIALGLVRAQEAFPGTPLDCGDVRGTVVAKPFYRRRR